MWLKIGNTIMNSNSDIFIGYLYSREKNLEFTDLKISTILNY